jgi:hypothetical protein
MTTLVEEQIIAILIFLIGIDKLCPSVDDVMGLLVMPTFMACRLLNLESFIEKPEKMARLMQFLIPDVMVLMLMLRDYIEQIKAEPIRYFVLIGRVINLCPSHIFSNVILHARQQMFDSDELSLMIRHFWKYCLAGRKSRGIVASEIESRVYELFMDLMFGRYRFNSTHWNYEEALLRLIHYCDRYVHPKITHFKTAIIEAIQQNEDTEWRKGCMRTYVALIHCGLIQDTTLNKSEFLIKNSF